MSNEGAPTHNLCVKSPGAKTFHQIGMGWQNEKGQIKLDAATTLRWDDGLTITLFQRNKQP